MMSCSQAAKLALVLLFAIACSAVSASTPLTMPISEEFSTALNKLPYEKEAVHHYNRAVQFHQASLTRDGKLADGTNLNKAREEYLIALKLDGRMAEAWVNLALLYNSQHLYPQAIEAFTNALQCKLEPEAHFKTASMLAHLYCTQGDFKSAEPLCKEVLASPVPTERVRKYTLRDYLELLEKTNRSPEAEVLRLKN